MPEPSAQTDYIAEPEAEGDDASGYLISHDELVRLGHGNAAKGRAQLRLLLADERERAPNNGPVERPASVRFATIRDEPAILDLLLADIAENATAVAPASIARIMANVTPGTRGQGNFALVVDDADGVPCGVAILAPMPWWWSDQVYLAEISMYVAPSARHTRAAHDLIQAECWLSQEMTRSAGHTVYVFAGVTATKRTRAKLRLYRRAMNPCGGFVVFPDAEISL